MTRIFNTSLALLALAILTLGCAGRPELIPNSDPSLRHTSAEFAADSAKRFPYHADAARGGRAMARAQVGYSLNKIELVNLDEKDWDNVEVWVNQNYVVFVPKMQRSQLKSLPFQMIYNDKGRSFPLDNDTPQSRVNKLEVFHDGQMFDVPLQLAD
jgi:hypothetical protein